MDGTFFTPCRYFGVVNSALVQHFYTPLKFLSVQTRGDIHQQFANKVREMFTDAQCRVRQVRGWGRRGGEGVEAPPPAPCTLLYICTVRELCRELLVNIAHRVHRVLALSAF
jgi:hypothetical protein